MHNCYMEKILSNNNKEEMEELRKVFDKAMHKVKELDKDEYDHLELWLYKIAYGKVLNGQFDTTMRPLTKCSLPFMQIPNAVMFETEMQFSIRKSTGGDVPSNGER